MAQHGKKRHLKRIAAPAAQPILRKEHVWLSAGQPGAHAKGQSVPLIVFLRDVLKVVQDGREANGIVRSRQVLLDGKAVSSVKMPVGLMDVITLPKLGASFTVLNVKGKLVGRKLTKVDSKLCKVTGKRLLSGGKTQLALHDGRTIALKEKGSYAVGDTLRLAVPTQKILEHFKLSKGAHCYVFKGRHAGATGKLEEIVEFPGITPPIAKIASDAGETTTLKDYVFVVDQEFKV